MTIKTQRLLDRAKKIANNGDHKEARKLYTTILEASPNNQEAKNGLLVLQQDKDQLRPSKAEIQSVFALYSNGQIQEALDTVETLTKGYPKEPLLYNISGVCYKEIGQLDAAIKSFEKALAIKPDYTEVNYNLGLTLQELGKLDAAVKSYEKALTLNPDYAEAHNNLGVLLKELGQVDDAVKSYNKALTLKPDYAEAYNNLGNAFKELGKVDDAVKSYNKALTLKPDYAEAHDNLDIVLKQLNSK